jgi:hypothetical protein
MSPNTAIVLGLLVGFVGCASAAPPTAVDTSTFAGANRVHITGNREARTEKDSRDISDPDQIAALYRLVASQPGKWHRYSFDAPSLKWLVEFSRDGKSLGSYGVGSNFLGMGPYVVNLTPDQQKLAARLLTASPAQPR